MNGQPLIGYLRFTTSRRKSDVFCFSTRDVKKRTILSLDLRIEVLCCLDEAHRVACLLPSLCGKTQMARVEADRAAIVAEWNSGDLVDINT